MTLWKSMSLPMVRPKSLHLLVTSRLNWLTPLEQLSQHAEGFQEIVNQAFERGVSEESIARIQEEYEGDGISEKSYKELAEAGYSKSFIDFTSRVREG